MKNLLMLLMLLFTVSVMAEESTCYDNPDEEITKFEADFKKCKDIRTDFVLLSEVQEASQQQIVCARDVAYAIIDRYYSRNTEEVKKHFDDITKARYQWRFDLEKGSDAARKAISDENSLIKVIQMATADVIDVTRYIVDIVADECYLREEIAEERRHALEQGYSDPFDGY